MAAVNSSTIHTASSKSRITSYRKSSFTSPSSSFLKVPTRYLTKCPTHALTTGSPPHHHPMRLSSISANPSPSSSAESAALTTAFQGLCYVVGDNIDTDQIIPTEYLTLVPSVREDKKKLGSYALCGLPSSYYTRFVEENEYNSKYSIVIAGANFGCGSSREHAPAAIGAAGAPVVVAESYARIFFRNSVATGEVYPLESQVRICEECKTGDAITIELAENKLINHTSGKQYQLKSVGDVGPVIESGGIFAYARDTGMLPSQSPA